DAGGYITASSACLLGQLEQQSDRELDPVGAEVARIPRILGEDEPQVGVDQEVGRQFQFGAEPQEEEQVQLGLVVAGQGDVGDRESQARESIRADRQFE